MDSLFCAFRLLTFRDWPQAMPQKPEELAEAGFFYLGRGDFVQCYYCNGGLKNWDPNVSMNVILVNGEKVQNVPFISQDKPWEEHARWFAKCGFLQLIKGKDFIKSCRRNAPRVPNEYQEYQDSSSGN